MSEQLFVIGLGLGDDADAALFASGLALEDAAGPTYTITPMLAGGGKRPLAMRAGSGKRAATMTARSGKRVEQED